MSSNDHKRLTSIDGLSIYFYLNAIHSLSQSLRVSILRTYGAIWSFIWICERKFPEFKIFANLFAGRNLVMTIKSRIKSWAHGIFIKLRHFELTSSYISKFSSLKSFKKTVDNSL